MTALTVIGCTSRSMVIARIFSRDFAYAAVMAGMIPSYATRDTEPDPTPNVLPILTLHSIY